MSVRPSAWNNSAPTGRILMKCDICVFCENLLRKLNFLRNRTRITVTLFEDRYTFMIISLWFLLRMRNVSDKSWIENQNTHFMYSNFFLENCDAYEIMWKNIVDRCRPQMAIWRHVRCMLNTQCYKHTSRICNTYYFSTATIVARTLLNVTLYVNCLCLKF
jgi:hypothetical protein